VQDLQPHPDRFAQRGDNSRWIGDWRRKQFIDFSRATTGETSGVALGDKSVPDRASDWSPW